MYFVGEEDVFPSILKKIDLPIIPHELCVDFLRKTKLGSRFNLHESSICGGGEIWKDTCKVTNMFK